MLQALNLFGLVPGLRVSENDAWWYPNCVTMPVLLQTGLQGHPLQSSLRQFVLSVQNSKPSDYRQWSVSVDPILPIKSMDMSVPVYAVINIWLMDSKEACLLSGALLLSSGICCQ